MCAVNAGARLACTPSSLSGHKAYTTSMWQATVCAQACHVLVQHLRPAQQSHPGAKVVFGGLRVWRHHQDIVPKLCMRQSIELSHLCWEQKQFHR